MDTPTDDEIALVTHQLRVLFSQTAPYVNHAKFNLPDASVLGMLTNMIIREYHQTMIDEVNNNDELSDLLCSVVSTSWMLAYAKAKWDEAQIKN